MTKARPAATSRSEPEVRPQLPKAPTGIQGLDEITGGGLPKGRPTLVCGGTCCGKTLLAMEFLVRGATQFNEPGVFMAFEETAKDLTQNVASLGFDLTDLVARNQIVLDYVYIERSEIEESGEYDLEGLFIRLGQAIDSVGARRVVLDTIESLFAGLPNPLILRAELRRLFRWLKDRGVTAIITGERGVLTGSARLAQEAKEQAAQTARQQDIERRQLDLERRRKAMEAQIAALRTEFEAQQAETLKLIGQEQALETQLMQEREGMALSRKADAASERKGAAK